MLKFRQPPEALNEVVLDDTDRPLPDSLNPNTRYMFLGEIAKGGKSIIMSCKDLHLSRVIAYKTLRSEFVDDEIENTRLLREARVSALLQHPNTVPVYEIVEFPPCVAVYTGVPFGARIRYVILYVAPGC